MSSVGLSIAVVYVVLAGVLTLVFVDIYTESSVRRKIEIFTSFFFTSTHFITNIYRMRSMHPRFIKVKLR